MDIFDAHSAQEFCVLNASLDADESLVQQRDLLEDWPNFDHDDASSAPISSVTRLSLLPLEALLVLVVLPVVVIDFLLAILTFSAFAGLTLLSSAREKKEFAEARSQTQSNGHAQSSTSTSTGNGRLVHAEDTEGDAQQSTWESLRRSGLMVLNFCQSEAVRSGIDKCAIPRNGS